MIDRRQLLVAGGAVGAAALGAWSASWLRPGRAASAVQLGQTRLDFELPDLAGRPTRLSQFDGYVRVVNFWATWCAPCISELPLFEDLHRTSSADELKVIGVALDRPEDARAMVAKLDLSFLILVGEFDVLSLMRAYGNSSGVLPYSLLINAENRWAGAHVGAFDALTLAAFVAASGDARP